MPVDFAAPALHGAYGGRAPDVGWLDWCREHLAPAGKDVADIGCGGGIYACGFVGLGARSVIGVDRSAQYVAEARQAADGIAGVRFTEGDAAATGLPDASVDLVFCRAVIHHLSPAEQAAAAAEWLRLLRPGGKCTVQDRTVADVTADDPAFWVRSSLFEAFPRLLTVEQGRRPEREGYAAMLTASGFAATEALRYAETRQVYDTFADLEAAILARKGKSILHELTDCELATYAAWLRRRSGPPALVEQDCWTVWIACKP